MSVARQLKRSQEVGASISLALDRLIQPPAQFPLITVDPLPSQRKAYIGRYALDNDIWVSLILPSPQRVQDSRAFQNLSVKSIIDATLTLNDGTSEVVGDCAVISMPQNAISHFLRISTEILELWLRGANFDEVLEVIDAWFAALIRQSKMSETAALGLWGELIVIRSAQSSDDMVAAWHNDSNSTYDFTLENSQLLEVKTTSKSRRQHHFSAGQTVAMNTDELTIFSLMAQRTENGVSINQLKTEILGRLKSAKSVKSFLRKFAAECNPTDTALDDLKWNLSLAEKLARLYDGADLVTPKYSFPIVEVNWTHDFEDLQGYRLTSHPVLGNWFRSIKP